MPPPTNFIDRTNLVYGSLTVVRRGPNHANGQAQWHCLCSCGSGERLVPGNSLQSGGIKTCGQFKHPRSPRKPRKPRSKPKQTPAEIKVNRHNHYLANRETLLAYGKDYYAANKNERLAYQQEWIKANPNYQKAWREKRQKQATA